jgi:hypothetical protein
LFIPSPEQAWQARARSHISKIPGNTTILCQPLTSFEARQKTKAPAIAEASVNHPSSAT